MKIPMPINVAVCEDNDIFCRKNSDYCKKFIVANSISGKVYEYKDGNSLLKDAIEPNILLLDIEIGDMNGIDIKNYYTKKNSDIKIIFLTNHNEYMREAFGKNVYENQRR